VQNVPHGEIRLFRYYSKVTQSWPGFYVHAAGQDVKQEAAQELMGGNDHALLLAAVGIVSPSEGDGLFSKATSRCLEMAARWV